MIAEEEYILGERATMIRYSYITYLVTENLPRQAAQLLVSTE